MPVSDYNTSDTTGASREENDVSPNQLLLMDDRTKPGVVKTENEKAREEPFSKVRKSERSKSEITPPTILDITARDEEEDQSATVVMPPDGGWGWVIVAASFVCNFIVDGILYSFGVFIKDVSQTFSVPEARVALVGSLLSGSYLIVGPFVSALSNHYGFRIVTIFGAILAAVGFALSAVAMNVEFLSFTYGIVGGIGFGMIYSPSIIIVGFYFEKWRALATGIAVCGSGIGTFVMAPLTEMCINKFQWHNALLFHAGILLICILCALLFRPLKPVKVTLEKAAEYDEENKPLDETKAGNIFLVKPKKTSVDSFVKTGSVTSLKSNKYPTAAEVLQITDGRSPRERSPTETAKMSKSTQSLNYKNMVLSHGDDMPKRQKRFSVPEFQDNVNKKTDRKKSSVTQLEESNGIGRQKKKSRTASETLSEISSTGKRSRRNTATSVTECTVRSRRGTITQLDENINRPIYRDDIFFSGSMNRIPQYKVESDALSYTLSVTRIPTKKDLEEEHKCRFYPEAVRRAMETMLDLSLLKTPSFMLLCASGFLTLFGFFVPFMFLADRATSASMNRTEAVWLISTIGITNTVGRILCGIFSSFPRIDALLVNNLALTIGGVSTLISGLSMTVHYQYTYAIVFGFAVACFASLRSIVLVELLGLEKLTNAFGILLLFQGIAAAVGAPIAGMIKEATGTYDASFYFSGSLILVSGLMLFPLRAINKWEQRKRKEDDVQQQTSFDPFNSTLFSTPVMSSKQSTSLKMQPKVYRSSMSENQSKSSFGRVYEKDDLLQINLRVVDSKYSWFVVLCSFFCNLIVDGMQYTFSNFLDPIMFTFNSTTMAVSLIGSLLSGFYNFSGPMAGALANKFGFRMVTITGSIMAAFGLGISYFSSDLGMLYFFYGAIGGLGFGMIYMAAVITTSLYFDKYRALATSISVCGTGIGTFVFSPLGHLLVSSYGWRLALVMEGGIVLSCILFGLAFKPIEVISFGTIAEGINLVQSSSSVTLKTIKTMQDSVVVPYEPQKLLPNEAYPTLKQALMQDFDVKSEAPKSDRTSAIFSVEQSMIVRSSKSFFLDSDSDEEYVSSAGFQKRKLGCRKRCRKFCFNFWHCRCHEKKYLTIGDRPMYRDDVFFEGSLSYLRQFSETDPIDYHLSVIRVPNEKDTAEHRRQKCCGCHEAMLRTIVTMTGLNLLKNITFIFLCLSSFLFTMGVFIPYIFLRELAEKKNIKEEHSIWLVSTIGIANTVGRLISGLLMSCMSLDAGLLVVFSTLISSLVCLVVLMPIVIESAFTFAVCFGFFTAPFVSLRPVVLVEFLGLEKLTNAFGLVLLTQGVASIIGPPVAGFLQEATGEIMYTIIFAGALLLTSATCILVSILLVRRRQRKGQTRRL